MKEKKTDVPLTKKKELVNYAISVLQMNKTKSDLENWNFEFFFSLSLYLKMQINITWLSILFVLLIFKQIDFIQGRCLGKISHILF